MKVLITLSVSILIIFFNLFSQEIDSKKEKIEDINLENKNIFILSTLSNSSQIDDIEPLTKKEDLKKNKTLADKIKYKIEKTIPFFEFKYDE